MYLRGSADCRPEERATRIRENVPGEGCALIEMWESRTFGMYVDGKFAMIRLE